MANPLSFPPGNPPRQGIDPNHLTKGEVFPWLSPRLQLAGSRTFWIIIAIAMLIALLIFNIGNTDIKYFLYVTTSLIILAFLFGLKMFLRSNASVFLLLFGFFGEYALLKSPVLNYWLTFWREVIPSDSWGGQDSTLLGRFFKNFFSAGIPEDTLKLLPVGLLLLLIWGLQKAPTTVISDSIKSKLTSWVDLSRPTTIIMIAFASASAFMMFETLEQYVWAGLVVPEFIRIMDIINHLPIDRTKGFPFTIANGIQISEATWKSTAQDLARSAGFMKGTVLMMPRALGVLFGHGAFASVAGYYIALSRHKNIKLSIFLVVLGFCVSATLHALWNTFEGDAESAARTIWMAPLIMFSGFVLLAVCVQAIELDRRMGFNDSAMSLGGSLTVMPELDTTPLRPEPPISSSPMAAPQLAPKSTKLVLKIGPVTLKLEGGLLIEPQLLGSAGAGRGKGPIAEIAANPLDAAMLGLRNLSNRPYRAKLISGKTIDVTNGQSVHLAPGIVIDFGGIEGVVQTA
jgi:RsiW-degrading membrane proteinase PrsW (M82 family)